MAAVDAYELLEAVEILSKMPKDFYEKIVRSFNCVEFLVHFMSLDWFLTDQTLSWIASQVV